MCCSLVVLVTEIILNDFPTLLTCYLDGRGVGFLHGCWVGASGGAVNEIKSSFPFCKTKCIGFQSPNEILSNRILFGLVIVFPRLRARKSAISDATTSGFPSVDNIELASKKVALLS